MVGQAARGDDRGAQHGIERPGQLRAGGAGEAGPRRFGPLQAGQLVAGGAGCGGDAGQEPGQPFGADPQRQAVVELRRRGLEGQGDVAAEAVLPQQAGGEEQPVHGERIDVSLPVDPVPGAPSGPDQRRTLIAPAYRGQPVIDSRIVDGHGPAQGVEGGPHGRDIGNRTPGAVLGEPPPEPRETERGGNHLVGRHHVGCAAPLGHGRKFGIEATGEGRDGVGAGQAGVAQGEIARMNPGVDMREPPGCLPIGDTSTQILGNRRRRGGRGCLQPGYGVRRVGERHEEGMGIRVADRPPAPDGGQKLGRIVVGDRRHESAIAQWLGRQDENNQALSFRMSCRSVARLPAGGATLRGAHESVGQPLSGR